DNEVGGVGLNVAAGDRVHGKTMRHGKERIRRDRDRQVAAADEGCGNRRAIKANLCGCVKSGTVNLYADKVSRRGQRALWHERASNSADRGTGDGWHLQFSDLSRF